MGTFLEELLNSSTSWSNEQWLARHAIIVRDFFATVRLDLLDPRPWLLEGVARVLCVMSVEAADSVSGLEVASISEVGLDRLFGGAMRLLAHDALFSHDWVPLSRAVTSGYLPRGTCERVE
jgi:hypothetical protein